MMRPWPAWASPSAKKGDWSGAENEGARADQGRVRLWATCVKLSLGADWTTDGRRRQRHHHGIGSLSWRSKRLAAFRCTFLILLGLARVFKKPHSSSVLVVARTHVCRRHGGK